MAGNPSQWWPVRGKRERAQERERKINKNKKKGKEIKGDMEPDPQDPVAAGQSAGRLGGWTGASGSRARRADGAAEGASRAPDAGAAAAGRGGGPGSGNSKTPNIHLPKMSADDDAQAFLEAFEVAAEACHWPREEWVVRLLPLLSGEAQQAA